MNLGEIKSEDLRRLLAVKSCKNDFKDITEEDLQNVREINLSARRFDGSESDIDLTVIIMLPNLKRLGVSDFHISQEILEIILSNKNLCFLEFTDCTFDQINFEDMNPDFNLRIRGCREINFKYPNLRRIDIIGSIVDFACFNLEEAKVLSIVDSEIYGIRDLSDFTNLEKVNLDGSTLYCKEEKHIRDISVSENTLYSHKDKLKLYDTLEK